MANPTDPSTGKPRRGRPRNSDKTDSTASGNTSGIDNSSIGISGNDSPGSASGNPGSNPNTSQGTTSAFQSESTRVSVEANTAKPKRTTTRKTPAKGAIKPEHVENWIVQGFGIVAMIRNASYWAISDPKIEVEPWSASAAEMLNKISGEHAEKITEVHAGVAVVFGIGALVYKRMQMDAMYARQKRMQEQQAYEDYPVEDINPDIAAERKASKAMPGTGAGIVSPQESIFGAGSETLNLRT